MPHLWLLPGTVCRPVSPYAAYCIPVRAAGMCGYATFTGMCVRLCMRQSRACFSMQVSGWCSGIGVVVPCAEVCLWAQEVYVHMIYEHIQYTTTYTIFVCVHLCRSVVVCMPC